MKVVLILNVVDWYIFLILLYKITKIFIVNIYNIVDINNLNNMIINRHINSKDIIQYIFNDGNSKNSFHNK